MRQLTYGLASVPLHFDFPSEWKASAVTAVNLTVTDTAGTSLLASTATTLYTATTLLLAGSRWTSSIKLAAAAGALSVGDKIQLTGIEGTETQVVKGFDSVNKIVELEGILNNDYAVGDTVRGLFCNYNINLSNTTTFPNGTIVVLKWTPTGSGTPVTEEAQIASTSLNISGLERRFSLVYPRAYEAFTKPTNRFAEMAEIAEMQVANELLSDGLDIQRIVNPDQIATVLMCRMAYIWTLNGDEQMKDERTLLANEYDKQIGWLKHSPIWVDKDMDLVEDDGETIDHEPWFENAW